MLRIVEKEGNKRIKDKSGKEGKKVVGKLILL